MNRYDRSDSARRVKSVGEMGQIILEPKQYSAVAEVQYLELDCELDLIVLCGFPCKMELGF
jgi:hypothetical protein